MSKLNSNKINFKENDFVVEINEELSRKNHVSKQELVLNRAQNEAQQQIEDAQTEADKIIESANQEALKKSKEIIDNAKKEADEILKEAKKQAGDLMEKSATEKNEILTNAQAEIEQASQEAANKGYKDGYDDAQKKFFEENDEKLSGFDKFCSYQNEIKDKILKNASKEILDIIQSISHKILLKELDASTLDKIIKNTISFLDKKENITIIVSEKYAKLLYELQKKEADIELNFEEFKQYENFEIVYNKELPDDTIIIENENERFCASIEQQLDKIMREIFNNTKNGNIDLKEYDETSTAE